MDITELQDRLLVGTLPGVLFDGWTDHALRGGAAAAGVGPELVLHAFPNGVTDLAAHFSDWADRAMVTAYAAEDTATLGAGARVALAARLRLEALADHREAVRSWLTWLALPNHASLALRLLHRTIDEIWHTAGDRSTDFSYYTKRTLLAGVYSAAVLYWLADESEGHAATWDFLERALTSMSGVGRTVAKAGGLAQVLNYLPSPVRFARQMRRRATGG